MSEGETMYDAVASFYAGEEGKQTAAVGAVHVDQDIEAHAADFFQDFAIAAVAGVLPVPFYYAVYPRLRAHDAGVHGIGHPRQVEFGMLFLYPHCGIIGENYVAERGKS